MMMCLEMARVVSIFTIWISLLLPCMVTSLVYQHTVFQRRLNPANDLLTSPLLSITVSNFQACINQCHSQPQCESLEYDSVTLKCSLFEGKVIVKEITSDQMYHEIVKKTVYQDIIARGNYLCNEDSPGYIYNESIPVCYKVDSNPRLLGDAVSFCGDSGGHLLRINTERKQRLVEDLDLKSIGAVSKYRIDGEKSNGIWKFSNEKLIKQFYWFPGEPKGGGSSIGLRVGHEGKWDDISETVLHGCICEKDIKFV